MVDGVESVRADASDPDALSRIVDGATALFNCANPGDYTTWQQVWPPLAESLSQAAERTGATLVVTSNLYPYGPTTVPPRMMVLTPDSPSRCG